VKKTENGIIYLSNKKKSIKLIHKVIKPLL